MARGEEAGEEDKGSYDRLPEARREEERVLRTNCKTCLAAHLLEIGYMAQPSVLKIAKLVKSDNYTYG